MTIFLFKNQNLNIYQKNCETFCHTATLLIHNLKYLAFVSYYFTTGKKLGRVQKDIPADKGLRQINHHQYGEISQSGSSIAHT